MLSFHHHKALKLLGTKKPAGSHDPSLMDYGVVKVGKMAALSRGALFAKGQEASYQVFCLYGFLNSISLRYARCLNFSSVRLVTLFSLILLHKIEQLMAQ